jgi:hypothetical protein
MVGAVAGVLCSGGRRDRDQCGAGKVSESHEEFHPFEVSG